MLIHTGRFVMFSVITNIYNKKIIGPTLMELFTATGKLNKLFFFWQLEMFDVCTTGDTAHIDTIFKFLPHTRQHGCIDILHCCNDPCLRSARSRGNGGTNTGSLTYPQRKNHRASYQGTSGAIATVVGHFQTHVLSSVLVTLCSGTDETHSGSGRDFRIAGIWTSVCFATVVLATVANMSRYVMPVTVSSAKKNGPHNFWLETAQNTLALGESRWCST